MTYAYDKNMVPVAQRLVAVMLDFSVYGLGYDLNDFYERFLNSRYSEKVEKGDSSTIMGMSGIELASRVVGVDGISNNQFDSYASMSIAARSPEFWTGWALSYYQWVSSLSFAEINEVRNINDIRLMYNPYHEMDIIHFCDQMRELYVKANETSRLKRARTIIGISQRELSELTGIPTKTIQQYEQKQKNINHARVDYLISLSKALNCEIEMLIEKSDII